MMAITKKLEEVYANFWGLYDTFSQFKSIYAAILMCKYTRKTWTLYLKEKNDFVNAS